jgi:amino acid transporter
VVNTIVNLIGIRSLARFNRVFLGVELVFLAIFVVIAVTALAQGRIPGAHFGIEQLWDADKVTPSLIAGALSIAVLSFLGFDGISTLSGGRHRLGQGVPGRERARGRHRQRDRGAGGHLPAAVQHVPRPAAARQRSRNYLLHLVVPVLGFVIIGYVLTQTDVNAKVGGVVWLVVGAGVYLFFALTGRSRDLTIGESS